MTVNAVNITGSQVVNVSVASSNVNQANTLIEVKTDRMSVTVEN